MKYAAMLALLVVLTFSPGAAKQFAAAEQPDAAQVAPLDDLAWMVGDWVDEGKDSTIKTTCSWTKNHKFLKQAFSITIDGKVSLEGTQQIGWDPIEKQIRSWVFDSEGGFGEGRWIKEGNRWLVKESFVLASGERASAVNVYTYVDANHYGWKSIDREVGGELQPNIPEVAVVRQSDDKTPPQNSEKEVSP